MTPHDIELITGAVSLTLENSGDEWRATGAADEATLARIAACVRSVGIDATTEAFAAEWARTAPNAVPASVSPYQFRAWCLAHGISMAQIDTLIDAIPDTATRELVRVEWEYGLVVKRAHPMIDQFGAALGMTGEQIDQAFREAAGMA